MDGVIEVARPGDSPARTAATARRWWAAGALALALLVISLDVTVLNLALPILSTDLRASTAQLQWTADAYVLVMAATLLPAGLLGDQFGRKRFLLAGFVLFGAASATAAYADTASALIAARAFLGLGAAALFTLSFAVVPVLFSERERPRVIAVFMGAVIVAYPTGVILGGFLLTHFWWGSVFLINVPVIGLALAAVAVLLPESRSAQRRHLDLGGVLVSSAGLVALTYGVIEAGERGWGNSGALAAIVAGCVVLTAFVYWERHISRRGGQPLADLTLFRSRSFTWGTILTTSVAFTTFGLLFTVPQYFQAVRGTSAMGAGLRLLPLIGGLLAGTLAADRLSRWAGAKITVAAGFALMSAGLLSGGLTSAGSGYVFISCWLAVLGAGLGFALPAAGNAALGTLSPERSGAGSASILTVRQVGGALGVAILGSVLNSAYRGGIRAPGLPAAAVGAARDSVSVGVAVAEHLGSAPLLASVRSAFVDGMNLMTWVSSAVALASVALTLAFLPRRTALAGTPEPPSPEVEVDPPARSTQGDNPSGRAPKPPNSGIEQKAEATR